MLGRLGLQFTRARNKRHQRQVNVRDVPAWQIVAELPNGFEIRQAFDVTHGPTDLAKDEIELIVALADELLDGVGNVRNDLDCSAEIVAATFLGEDFLINAPSRDVVLAGRRPPGKAFVMTQVEVSFGTVIGDKNLAVL